MYFCYTLRYNKDPQRLPPPICVINFWKSERRVVAPAFDASGLQDGACMVRARPDVDGLPEMKQLVLNGTLEVDANRRKICQAEWHMKRFSASCKGAPWSVPKLTTGKLSPMSLGPLPVLSVVPMPSCPNWLRPQHFTSAFPSNRSKKAFIPWNLRRSALYSLLQGRSGQKSG